MSKVKRQRSKERRSQSVFPDKKKCGKCRKWKKLPNDYYFKRKTLAGGEVIRYPESVCKECAKKRNRRWREAKRESGELLEIERRYRKKHERKTGKKKMRRRRREQRTSERRKRGSKPTGRGKYEDAGTGKRVPAKPLKDFVEEIRNSRKMSMNEIARRVGIDRESLQRSLNSPKGLTLGTVDSVLMGLDRQEMLTILYGDEVVNDAA